MNRSTGPRPLHRRRWMQLAAGLAAGAMRPARGDEPSDAIQPLLVRGSLPLNAETPVSALSSWITPNRQFFVRSHFGAPAVNLRPWGIAIEGAANGPARIGLDDLARLEPVTIAAVLQCSGNGRAQFSPTIPGVGWVRGAVGNAEWTGPRLVDVLKAHGIPDSAAHVHFLGADAPPNPKTPAFFRSLPREKALDPSTILATSMNGEPLPVLHGGPVRLVVPGWGGNHWIKWLRVLALSTEEAPGFYQRTGYRMPKEPVPPGAAVKPEDLVPVTAMNVKSLVTAPAQGGQARPGEVEVRGVAWTGVGRVTKVEVAVDDGPWREAELYGPDRDWAWRQWRSKERLGPGRHVVKSRATDSGGDVQPEVTPWNKSGYLWNGIDPVAFEVANS